MDRLVLSYFSDIVTPVTDFWAGVLPVFIV